MDDIDARLRTYATLFVPVFSLWVFCIVAAFIIPPWYVWLPGIIGGVGPMIVLISKYRAALDEGEGE